MDHMIDEGKVK